LDTDQTIDGEKTFSGDVYKLTKGKTFSDIKETLYASTGSVFKSCSPFSKFMGSQTTLIGLNNNIVYANGIYVSMGFD
jgi:hypothetical protein